MSQKTRKILAITGAASILAITTRIITLSHITYHITINRITIPRQATPHIISPTIDPLLTIPLIAMTAYTILKQPEKRVKKILALLTPTLLAPLTWANQGKASIIIGIISTAGIILTAQNLNALQYLARYTLYTLTALETTALAYWILHPALPNLLPNDPKWGPAWLETQLFYTPHPLTGALTLALLYSWLLRPLANKTTSIKSIRVTKQGIQIQARSEQREEETTTSKEKLTKSQKALAITAPVLALLATIYPYLPTINPTLKPVSVDIVPYIAWLKEMTTNTTTTLQALSKALITANGTRPLTLALFYLAYKASPLDLETTMKLIVLPLITPLLPTATYVLTRQWRKEEAPLAALLTIPSAQVLVGIYAGYHANLLTLPILYTAQALALKALQEKSIPHAILASLALTTTTLTHVWTWQMGTAVLVVYIILTLLHEGLCPTIRKLPLLALIIAPSILTDMLRPLARQPTGASIGYQTAAGGISILNLYLLNQNLNFLTNIFVGGYTANWPLLALAIIGSLALDPKGNPLDRLLTAWLITSSIPFPIAKSSLQNRLLFNTPIQILAAIGLQKLAKNQNGKLLKTLMILALTTHALRSLANIIPP